MLLWSFVLAAPAQACTTIALGKAATSAGFPISTFNADTTEGDFRMAYIPASDHVPGATKPIYPNTGAYPRYVGNRSATYAPGMQGRALQDLTAPLGYIPQVSHTYAYWETLYPIMNEKGLAFGESTCFGKIRANMTGVGGGTALFYVHSLMQIAMERCDTARCAIETMGHWAVKEGFYGEDVEPSEGGEALSVIDHTEAWIFHVMADFHGSAVWAAQRVPDGHAAVVGNNFIIRKIPFNDSDSTDFLYSDNILGTAQQLVNKGLADASCSDSASFDFMRCFGADLVNDVYDPGYGPAVADPYYTTMRMWRVHNLLGASTCPAEATLDVFTLPFSFPVDEPVSVETVMRVKRDQLEGTIYDLSKDALAGPFGDPNRNQGGEGMLKVPGKWPRAISLLRTSYAIINNPTDANDLFWFTMHQPASAVYVPFFAQATGLHESYTLGSQLEYDKRSAWWAFSFVSNWMRLAWQETMEKFVLPARNKLQEQVIQRVASLATGATPATLTEEQTALQGKVVADWIALGEFLVMGTNNGLINYPKTAGALGYPESWLREIGFDMSVEPRPPRSAIAPELAAGEQLSVPDSSGGYAGFGYGLLVGAIGTLSVMGLTRRSCATRDGEYAELTAA